jgi:hypothetical protein
VPFGLSEHGIATGVGTLKRFGRLSSG